MATRRTAVSAPAPAPPAVEGPNFGERSFYSSGFLLPKGQYALYFAAIMFQPERGQTPPRLGIEVTAYDLTNPATEHKQFYSMGQNADKSFMPNPDTGGKTLLPVPGGPASGMAGMTNWSVFLDSLYNAGLPEGVFTNNLTAIDGVWVNIDHEPEPSERKNFKSKTAEGGAQQQQSNVQRNIAVVTDILDGGKPWEGTGGIPAAPAAPAPAAARPAAVARPAAAPAARPAAVAPTPIRRAPAPAPAPVVAAAADTAGEEAEIKTAAIAVMSDLLGSTPQGMSKLLFKNNTFKGVQAAYGDDMAQAVLDSFFVSDDALTGVVGELGYGLKGPMVAPLA